MKALDSMRTRYRDEQHIHPTDRRRSDDAPLAPEVTQAQFDVGQEFARLVYRLAKEKGGAFVASMAVMTSMVTRALDEGWSEERFVRFIAEGARIKEEEQ